MIEITFKPDKLELHMTGHANQSKKGTDIVCAGASTLAFTLARALENTECLKETLVTRFTAGDALISCKPPDDYANAIMALYWAILQGFEMMQEKFPENIKLTIIEEQ